MQISDVFQILAILLEAVIAVIAILIAVKKQRSCGWFIALTFALFVAFDLARILGPGFPGDFLSFVLLAGCASMTYAVWLLWKEK